MLKLVLKFAMVRLCGVGINMLVFMGLIALGANYLPAAACSFVVAVQIILFGICDGLLKDEPEIKVYKKNM